MKVLMLGNSFTYYHDMPKILAALLDAEVESVTRGGAYLYQMLDPSDELSTQVMEAINRQHWDYIVVQEQSNTPALKTELYHKSVRELCSRIRQNGAQPVIYASWAYREGSEKLASTGFSYAEMDRAMYDSCHAAAKENSALIADVGRAFTAVRDFVDVYEADDYHPSAAGSVLAAHVIASILSADHSNR